MSWGKNRWSLPRLLIATTILWIGATSRVSAEPMATTQPAPATRPSVGPTANTSSYLTSLSLEDLMNVEVTSVSKTKERVADAPAAVTVITQDDIQQSGLHNIPEILRLAPGLFVQHGGQLTGWSVGSRGFAETFDNKLLVLQDGRTVYTPYFAGTYWNTVDYVIDDLDRVEVIRGPGSTLWGSNAVNGVINITSKSAKDTQGLLVDSRLGTDESDVSVRYGGQLDDRTYYRVYVKGQAWDDLHGGTELAGINQWQDSRGGFRIDRYATDKDTFTLQGDTFYQSVSDDGALEEPVPGYTHDYHSGANLLGRWSHVVSDKSDFTLQTYYDRFDNRDSALDYHQDTFDIDYQHRFQYDSRNELMYGMGARLVGDSIGKSFLVAPMVTPDSRITYLASAFLQDTITLVPDKWKLILGSKFEYTTFTHFDYQPSARVVWTPDTSNSVWAAFSRSVRTPSRWQHDSTFDFPIPIGGGQTGILDITSAPNLQSEKLLAYEVGYRHAFNKNLSADVSGFIDNYDDLIAEISSAPVLLGAPPAVHLPTEWVNDGTAESYGVEIAANWQVTDNWRLSGSDSFLNVYRHASFGTLTFSEYAVEHSSPANQFQLHSHTDITPKLAFNASFYYVGGVVGNLGDRVPSYTRTDMNVVWKPKTDLDIAVGVQNAFMANHREVSGQEGTSEVPRSAYVEATWKY
jgi:iron complex outermembrane recepter protein